MNYDLYLAPTVWLTPGITGSIFQIYNKNTTPVFCALFCTPSPSLPTALSTPISMKRCVRTLITTGAPKPQQSWWWSIQLFHAHNSSSLPRTPTSDQPMEPCIDNSIIYCSLVWHESSQLLLPATTETTTRTTTIITSTTHHLAPTIATTLSIYYIIIKQTSITPYITSYIYIYTLLSSSLQRQLTRTSSKY